MQTVESLDMLRENRWTERSPALEVYILQNLMSVNSVDEQLLKVTS